MAKAGLDDAQATPAQASDSSLLRRYRGGCQDAATLLYARYAERLRALVRAQCPRDLARRIDAEDIVQSVFRSFFQRAYQGFYDVPNGEDLWKLFLIIALNKIRNQGAFHRAAKRDVRLTAAGDDFEHYLDGIRDGDGPYALLQLVIDEALDQLPADHRVVVGHRLEGFEVAEIARLVGRSKRSVERLLQESRKQLQGLFQED
jgi:RNA polymerase sigma-70 factor (ECF subfamily)